jgi:hypothetical protein
MARQAAQAALSGLPLSEEHKWWLRTGKAGGFLPPGFDLGGKGKEKGEGEAREDAERILSVCLFWAWCELFFFVGFTTTCAGRGKRC